MLNELLHELGLSKYEIKIYLQLVENGSSLAGTVAEKAKINRRNVYDALNRLSSKGFVSSIVKNNKKYYNPVNPKKILSLYEEKVDLVKNVLPELLAKQSSKSSNREVHVFEGDGGIKTVFTKLFEEKQSLFTLGATGQGLERMPFFFENLLRKEKPKNIKIKELWNYDAVNIHKHQKLFCSENRILPKNFKTSTQIFISGEISVILIWSSIPLAILIIDQEITHGFMNYFNFLWNLSKPI